MNSTLVGILFMLLVFMIYPSVKYSITKKVYYLKDIQRTAVLNSLVFF